MKDAVRMVDETILTQDGVANLDAYVRQLRLDFLAETLARGPLMLRALIQSATDAARG